MAFRMVGNRHEAEDIVQETFRSAWKSRQGYQAGRGQRAWLASILRRRVVDRWRRRDLTRGAKPEFTDQIEVLADDPLANDYTDEMQHALDRLPNELRDTLLVGGGRRVNPSGSCRFIEDSAGDRPVARQPRPSTATRVLAERDPIDRG